MPISGRSAISRATVRPATPLNSRKVSASCAHKRIVVDQRGDLAFEGTGLALEQGDHLVEARLHLRVIEHAAAALLLDREVVGDLAEPCHQGLQALLGLARQRGRSQPFGIGEAGDDGGVDPVGLLQNAHRLGVAANAAGVGQRAADACSHSSRNGTPFVAAGRLHHHQLDRVLGGRTRQFCDACRIVVEACRPMPGLDAGIKPGFRNIHSTNRSSSR